MRRMLWMTALLGAALMVVPGYADGLAQSDSGATAKQDMKDAGHHAKDGAKDAAHGVKTSTKKAYHKTKNTTKGAVKGGKEGAKEPQ